MRINLGTFAFGYRLKSGGGTPNWATALGQGKGYKINNDSAIHEILKGMIYTAVPLDKISTKIGKSGNLVIGNVKNSPIVLGSVFKEVYVNDTLIHGGKFILLITRDTSPSHAGRLRVKYGPSNTYVDNNETYSNQIFLKKAKEQLGLAEDACWFISDINIINQDILRLNAIIVNKYGTVDYADSTDLHHAWENLLPPAYQVQENTSTFIDENLLEELEKLNKDTGCNSIVDTTPVTCLDITRPARATKLYPLNSIIYGAPGTGKTYSTAEYAQAIISNISIDDFRSAHSDRKEIVNSYNNLIKKGQIVFTTFHQSYGYEEFIQGLRPDTSSDIMNFITVDGVFKRIADKALVDLNNNYVIIIDEINRANISKVFGELITLIEEDKRWGEINQTSATLQSGDIFAVPNNLYILGTMNSADKSISLIDAALRRRFDFIEQRPDSSLVSDPEMRKILERLNDLLAEQLESPDLLIGHSYFMNKTISDLPTVLNNSIIPLLYEYFYDNKKKVMGILNNAVKTTDYIVEDNKLGRIFIERQMK